MLDVGSLRRYLLENILLSHQFLSFPVGFVDHDLKNVLTIVWNIHHEEHQILQELGDRSDWIRKRDMQSIYSTQGYLASS